MESETMANLILGSGIIILYIIIVYGLPECVLYGIYDTRDYSEGNLISRIYPICMFIQIIKEVVVIP